MTSRILIGGALCLLAACSTPVPDSNPGVGFSDYDYYATERARRDAELQAMRPRPVPSEAVIGQETLAVLEATRPGSVAGTAPVTTATGPNVAPTAGTAPLTSTLPPVGGTVVAGTDNPTISDEQSFDAVAGRETIESDAERLERLRAQRQEVAPVPVPERTESGRPNVVAFALSSQNRVGEQVYRRSGTVSASRFQRNCARYSTADQAQEDFLAAGGPERDRRGLDPDGDGFACFWDPSPFRAARGG
ncbi:hypothetical protein GQ651_01340 [Alphaproteobacteria bacterium GH1-50]|uniref:Excalibur calcium-binding domain-containing protein n=1 Tax=Kangsaoukella pontilimi TaxID=2691042 RepID=A0A7C9IFZ9_9RHOB|nr:hypothetical protein [Kangsaoukella pontilimi]MXQ06482.1 hypothetical protein [Kangsaoukella pontilimi]